MRGGRVRAASRRGNDRRAVSLAAGWAYAAWTACDVAIAGPWLASASAREARDPATVSRSPWGGAKRTNRRASNDPKVHRGTAAVDGLGADWTSASV
jgi:hypothetical protein